MIAFPKPLRPGDLIAVTAPSSGVEAGALPRLELVLEHLRVLGYRVVEGPSVRRQNKDASGPRHERARELWGFLNDPEVAAVFPPWGGELASDLLELIDFESLRALRPKWLLGYSDISTLQLPLTLLSGWATAHGPNLMDLAPTQTDPLTTGALAVLGSDFRAPVVQRSSAMFQKKWVDFALQPDAPLQLTERTEWKRLDGSTASVTLRGQLIGGCLDTIAWLAGSKYGEVPSFVERAGRHGAILFLENVEMAPPGLVRALLSLRRHGWFDGLAGLLVGRNAGPEPESGTRLGYVEALQSVLGDLGLPVLYDVDIGHRPPQCTLINGAIAEVRYERGGGEISQVAVSA